MEHYFLQETEKTNIHVGILRKHIFVEIEGCNEDG